LDIHTRICCTDLFGWDLRNLNRLSTGIVRDEIESSEVGWRTGTPIPGGQNMRQMCRKLTCPVPAGPV